MSHPSSLPQVEALLVLPRLRVQNANAIASPLTHGFPSITAFTGLMWALQRKLTPSGIPLRLDQVGVICHHHEEQVTDGYVKTFCLTRNPVDSDGQSASIAEEGRIHLEITLVFQATLVNVADELLPVQSDEAQLAQWAVQAGEIVAQMRIAGGSVLPAGANSPRRTHPWMARLSEVGEEREDAFVRWRRQWLPGYALVGRDDLLMERHRELCTKQPDATSLDAWLHAASFNYEPVTDEAVADEAATDGNKKLPWADPARQKGGGWTVPIAVGYAALRKPHPPGSVANARDESIPFVFVESVYSFGQWISPHRLKSLRDLMWRPETDLKRGLYRCRSGYRHDQSSDARIDKTLPDFIA